MIIIGIDEAGRGPVLGPMVVCAFAIEKEREEELKKLGVKDSKELTKNKRAYLKKLLENLGYVEKRILEAEEINQLMNSINLNDIEINAFSKVAKNLIEKLNIRDDEIEIYIDACSTNTKKFEDSFKDKIEDIIKERNLNIKIIAEHKADAKYPVVSAASIIAKAERDEIIDYYKKIYGDIGSGYPSDPKTIKFLEDYFKKHKKLPDIARTHWKTCKRILDKSKQTKLIIE
ncbi:TPA: ribonuclease HII [Methanocaldococcus jannaschii]|uniref:Ribonuclease HII n=2 Tax=Methanocaldococcus jannaschii TaxID=2190 RepID=RNH2_METJA|nr:ribonuclease HII [Methanocaldococcus jannaschii]Q57599.1 RecName: Full=Ribonuclease HII; Short=RNase HII [Methanocaldococcus jannaschii DSM 2661]AAB98116.1 ribonuclease HII (rnhB) [Methanocaldococcus jannaschii DSM 2661]HII59629.1 ribonuclease HII [Methanocaldococcus jannaschii]